ncbi:DUF2750 domain-containing protein [Alteromonas sp. 5E99-2]|uniref:DUF2750 domain-containing protein n=1 Tax=Alteromonas sp. 5E99-2 TaxID=2817683 RepID=UPI001A98A084|nr:DUF2750 domain-containing protein [Alteromonas sp. 5E99-2]MBO1254926.1 DUF2750 domain-containing protein [Alteromonas sp. 5E99-2]
MALTLTDTLAQEWAELEAELRQQSFFEYLPSTLEVWGVQGSDGWVMAIRNESECLPIWTHEKLADNWLQKFHPDAKPCRISLNEFKTTWLPGLKNNQVNLLISPSAVKDDVIVMSAEECSDELS